MGAEQKYLIKFTGIQIVSKELAERPADMKPLPIFNFEIKVENKVQAQHNLVFTIVHITITEAEKPAILSKLTSNCVFEIENFKDVIKLNENGLFHIPPNLDAILRPVAISTTRGILYSEFRGTYLDAAIMPIIFMDTLKQLPIEEE